MIRLRSKIFALLILTFTITNIVAQDGGRMEDIKQQLNRLEEKIREARHFSTLFSNSTINQIIQTAENYHLQAREAFHQKQYIRTVTFIKLAYFELSKIYREIKSNSLFRIKFKEKLEEKIQEAEQYVAQSQNSDAENFLNRSKFFRQRAFQLSLSDRPEAAMKNYFLAIFFADNAIRTASGENKLELNDLKRFFEDTRSLFLQVKEMDGFNQIPNASNVLNQAEKELSNAQRLYNENRPRRAFQKLQLVNRMLYRVIDLLESEPAAVEKRLETDLQVLETQINEIQPEILETNSEDLNRLFERLVFLTTSAKEKFETKDYPAARNRLGVANRLLYRLHSRLKINGVDQEKQIKNQLQTAEIMMQSLQREKGDNQVFQQLIQLLNNNLTAAKKTLKNGNYRLSMQYLRTFNSLALKMDQLRIVNRTKDEKIKKVNDELQRLRSLLENPPTEIQTNDIIEAKYKNAQEIFQIAQHACEEQKFTLCSQLTSLAINIITQ